MHSRLLFLLFSFIFIFSLTFSSNYYKKRKRRTKKNIVNPQDPNAQDNCFQIKFQPSDNFQVSNIIFSDLLKTQNLKNSTVSSDLLSNKLLNIPNIFRYIFAYLSLFELELNFKSTSTSFYHLYAKFLKEEKTLLQECLKNKTKFLENINCPREYFDFFEKRQWNDPSRVEYANVDCFSEDLILFPKSIRQIICSTFQGIEYKYVLFKNGHLSILKKLTSKEYFVFTSLETDFKNFDDQPFNKANSFQENVRWIEIQGCYGCLDNLPYLYRVYLHKFDNFIQHFWNSHDFKKTIVSETYREPFPTLFLKNLSGYLYGDEFVDLWKFEKHDNGIYMERITQNFKTNVKKIKSQDFEHYVEDVPFIFKTN